MLRLAGRSTVPGGNDMRPPGNPAAALAVGEPAAWNTANTPVSNVIRCPDTFSSVTRFCAAPCTCAAAALGLAVPASDIQGLALLLPLSGANDLRHATSRSKVIPLPIGPMQ